MKIGKTDYVRVTMSEDDMQWLGSQRVDVEFMMSDNKNWLKITGHIDGRYGITKISEIATLPYRFALLTPELRGLPTFKAEEVTVQKGPRGTLWASKPTMSRAPSRHNNGADDKSKPSGDGFDDLRAAVAQLNELRNRYGSQLTFVVNQSGFIEVRMTLEIK